MKLRQLVLLLGVIGMKISGTKTELLPPPVLALETPGVVRGGQSANLQCTAPPEYKEGIFYLYLEGSGEHLLKQYAQEARHSVTFSVTGLRAADVKRYYCRYQAWLSDTQHSSEASNVLQVTVYVPIWVIAVSAAGGAAVVAIVVSALVLIMKRRNDRKKQKQRERESVWTSETMASDWAFDNMVYYKRPTFEISQPAPLPGGSSGATEGRVGNSFSTFLTIT
ncbi:hypothetical protein XENTR_v10010026 [Xenopus tropicalis]|uniref:Protein HIDE1-like n=1 Tax=Xenopus tropicalis TaxID=8364 RepID=A0A8J1JF64_XENTR|nr:protein HIDE1-like [Xenopus tropicalis]KAE8619916.1 hypothetical protein XENTR_v10010026 [Xenopus tropicalis]